MYITGVDDTASHASLTAFEIVLTCSKKGIARVGHAHMSCLVTGGILFSQLETYRTRTVSTLKKLLARRAARQVRQQRCEVNFRRTVVVDQALPKRGVVWLFAFGTVGQHDVFFNQPCHGGYCGGPLCAEGSTQQDLFWALHLSSRSEGTLNHLLRFELLGSLAVVTISVLPTL